MTQQDILTETGYFLWKNKLYILLVIFVFSGLSIYIAINNIKFEKKKMKVAKVLVVEKMTTAPPSLEELNTAVQNQTSNNETFFFKALSTPFCIVGPSAIGSVNGTPNSIRSTPDSTIKFIIFNVDFKSGSPQTKYVMKAVLLLFFCCKKSWLILFTLSFLEEMLLYQYLCHPYPINLLIYFF